MSFVIPFKYRLQTLLKSNNAGIKLYQIPEKQLIAIHVTKREAMIEIDE